MRMKKTILFLGFIILMFTRCVQTVNELSGSWIAVGINLSDTTKLSNEGVAFGIAIANLAQALSHDTFAFRGETVYLGDKPWGRYDIKKRHIIHQETNNSVLSCTYEIRKDSLWVKNLPEEGTITVLKRL